MKTKIVFLGSRSLGKKILQFLQQQDDIEIVGNVVLPADKKTYWIDDPGDIASPIVSLDDLNSIDFDLGISIKYWKIIPPDLLKKPRLGFVNLHNSYNLRFRGRNCTTFAILKARPDNIWYHGSTLHRMVAELDAGPIISASSCPILETDTAGNLFERDEVAALEMSKIWLPRTWRNDIVTYQPPSAYYVFKNKDLGLASPDLAKSDLDLYDRVRALTFPGMPLPTMNHGGCNLSISPLSGYSLYADAGNDRKVFSCKNNRWWW